MDAFDELLAAMQRMMSAQEPASAPRPDEGNFRCVRCEGCSDCRFCIECVQCEECTYCESCTGCRGCTQCRACRDCVQTSHSVASLACDGCSYTVLSVGCEECVHCFGCVGLAKGEFCVLNEPHSRRDYQTKVTELRAILDARLAKGWRPPWLVDEPSEDEQADDDEVDEGSVREPDAPTAGRHIEEGAAPRASTRDTAPSVTTASPPTPEPTLDRGGPSVTRAGRPAPAIPAPAPAGTASVLTGRRPARR